MSRVKGRTILVCALGLCGLVAYGVAARARHFWPFPIRDEQDRVLAYRAMELHRAHHFSEAAALYREALALREDPETRANLARSLAAAGDSTQAAAEFQRALADDGTNGALWHDYGLLLEGGLKDLAAAEEALFNATKYAPSLGEAQFDLGRVLLARERWDEAKACLEAAINLAPPRAAWLEEAQQKLVFAHLHGARAAQGAPKKP